MADSREGLAELGSTLMYMRPRTSSRRNWLRALLGAPLLVLPLLVLSTGCLSPTLPLPPPNRPDVSPPDSSGFTTLVGSVPGGTTAIAQNLENGHLVGQVTGSSGGYTLRLEAAIGDPVVVWYRSGLEDSGAVQVTVPATSSVLGPLGGATGTEN
jgi:hypothetical protein